MATPLQDQLSALYALQQIDTQIQRAKKAQKALDDGTQAAQLAQATRDEEKSKRATAHQASADLKDSELKLDSIENKRKTYQQRLYQGTITNAKELANIEREIDALGRQRADLDDKILTLMEEVEQARTHLAKAEQAAGEAETRRTDVQAAFRSRFDALELEAAQAMRQRASAVGLITDAALLKRYEDIRARTGGIGIVKIQGNDCGGCHMTLPTGEIKAVKEGRQLQTCENCGRILASA